MAGIPGWAYVITGVAIALYSKFVQHTSGSKVMGFFFWIGILFLTVGVFKMLLRFITRGEKESQEKNFSGRSFIVCPRCNARLDPRSRYCNWCGARVG